MNAEKKDSKIKILIPILLIIIMLISFMGFFVVRVIKGHEVSEKSVISYLQKKYKDDEFSDVKLIDKKVYNYMAKCDGQKMVEHVKDHITMNLYNYIVYIQKN